MYIMIMYIMFIINRYKILELQTMLRIFISTEKFNNS